MKENFPQAVALLLKTEGGYVDDAHDPGGRTNLGVTQAAWEAFRGTPSSEAEMRALTPKDVIPFYRVRYWDACKCDALPDGLDYVIFDYAVNSGPSRAIHSLQEILGVPADGKIGPKTLAAVSTRAVENLIQGVCDSRLAFMRAAKNPKTQEPLWPRFGRGWGRRVADVQGIALRMVSV